MKRYLFFIILFLMEICLYPAGWIAAEKNQETTENKTEISTTKPRDYSPGTSTMLGMDVTGNKESPRSLTIVPWRTAQMDGESPEISPYWQPTLKLLEPESYRRNVNLFLIHRQQNANQ